MSMHQQGEGKRGGGPRLGDRRRLGRGLPVAFLALSLGVAGFGALEAFRAQRSHEDTATQLLQDYSEFAAWSYERGTWDLLSQAIDNHLEIAYSNPQFALGQATDACLMLILDPAEPTGSCDCAPHLAGSYSFFTRIGEPVSESQWAGELPGSMHQTGVVEAVQRHARDVYRDDWRFALVHVEDADGAPIVAYTVLESPNRVLGVELRLQRDSVIYGFEVDKRQLADLYAQALAADVLLPPSLTRNRRNDEVIHVAVLGPDGSALFESEQDAQMAYAAPVERSEQFGGGEIRASVLPEVAGELIIGGLPGDRTGVLALIFSLAAALAVLAIVQLRREDQLALLRQDFVASVSHELRTPLAQVRLFTETLRLGRTRTEEQGRWALRNIDRETLRLTNLVDNILHFSRTERGVHQLERDVADVAEIVREAIASFEPLLPDRAGDVVAEVPDGLIADVHGDSIRQVVLNLLDNAVRYGRQGEIRVTGEATDDVVRVCVDDEGPGVPMEERQRIFERFHRGAQSVGTVVVGSGIGLSVVRDIVAAHDGRVWVEDAPGGGARFVVELPAVHTASAGHFASDSAGRESASGVA